MTRSVRHLIAIVLLTVGAAGIVSAPRTSHVAGALSSGGPLAMSSSFTRL
jgi:hypothetical protein